MGCFQISYLCDRAQEVGLGSYNSTWQNILRYKLRFDDHVPGLESATCFAFRNTKFYYLGVIINT